MRVLDSTMEFVWFIPACAGNMDPAELGVHLFRVHPRACGEHVGKIVQPHVNDGSSPRLRGTCSTGIQFTSSLRFIPAPAGNI